MRRNLTLAVSLLAIMALALIGATAVVAANPHVMYTCTKTKKNGQTDVKTSVPETAVGGMNEAGFTCVAVAPADEEDVEEEEDVQDEDTGETQDEKQGDDSVPEEDPEPKREVTSSPVTPEAPSESRSLYCSTKGPVERGNGAAPGVALNLPQSQGALLVETGLATPGIFYAGIGVSCDLLPGFTYSGFWVDQAGDVVPGVAVYPYYVPTS